MNVLGLMILLLFCVLNVVYYLYFRRKFVRFSEEILWNTRRIMGNEKDFSVYREYNKETLTSKVVMELEKTEEILRSRMLTSEQEKERLQRTISEIAHQVKTPLSNICMYHDMLSDSDISKDEADTFRRIISQQLEKLEFLIDSLIKSSRLESDMIRLNVENSSIFHILELAVNDIVHKAERKKIELTIRCDPDITAFCDVKWTAEAVGNILDNAVKYTPEGGNICIDACPGEVYTEIKVQDTGRGIDSGHYNDIFKRFYRESSVSKEEGLGLGLYISRNIITLQRGYIMVHSVPGRGSCFSVFLPH
ncbi:MAG: HAMP domain-containing histidine kinase [Lachnospiraceae bacterium]